MKKIFSFNEILLNAKENSKYYKELYKDLNVKDIRVSDLPIVDQVSFWKANRNDDNQLLTSEHNDGIVLKSGGTTGHPKFSVFTQNEWETFTQLFGEGLDHVNLSPGDRVGNLFYSGALYASFIFIMKSIEYAKTPTIHFPITGATPISDVIDTILENNINVLAGVPTSFMNLAMAVEESGKKLNIKRILYGGESLYDDQRVVLERVFPGVEINSIGYASVDGGHLGFVDQSCARFEHRPFLDSSIMEIVDEETGEPIEEENRKGRLIYTNLTRKLMPIIRYSVGDMAMWTSSKTKDGKFCGTKFLLMGRSEDGARVGPVTVNRDDISDMLSSFVHGDKISNFQLLINHIDGKDELVLRLAVVSAMEKLISKSISKLEEHFYNEREMFKKAYESNLICPLNIEIVSHDELVRNPRTGKLRSVIDRR